MQDHSLPFTGITRTRSSFPRSTGLEANSAPSQQVHPLISLQKTAGNTATAALINASHPAATPIAQKTPAATKVIEVKIYAIDPKTGHANLSRTTHDPLGSEYFIDRHGTLSKTSKDTIERINNPGLEPPIAAQALKILKLDIASSGGKPGPDYYASFSRSVYEGAIRILGAKDVDSAVSLVDDYFGTEVGDSPIKSVYHLYEAVFGGWDKVQHFVHSAALQYNWNWALADASQYAKELLFDEIPSWFGDDEGYSAADMLANNRGQHYGNALFKKYHPLRRAFYHPIDTASEKATDLIRKLDAGIRNLYGLPF